MKSKFLFSQEIPPENKTLEEEENQTSEDETKDKSLELEHEDPKNDVILPNVQESEETMPENKSDVKEKNKTLELEHEDPKMMLYSQMYRKVKKKCWRTKVMLKKKQNPGTRTQRPQK